MKRFYSAENDHGTKTSHGFSNETSVYVWNSRDARDKHIETCGNISAKPVLRKDVTKQAANWSINDNKLIKPDTFKGEFWGIPCMDEIDETGYIGAVTICQPDDFHCDRFYN